MSKKQKNPNSNSSMFLYTALIFVVALILIIIAFFGQKNLMDLRRTTDAMSEPEQTETIADQTPSPEPRNDELAVMTNTISTLQAENTTLKSSVDIYEKLLAANGYISSGNNAEAEKIISEINSADLTGDQLILYNQILTTVNEGKEQ